MGIFRRFQTMFRRVSENSQTFSEFLNTYLIEYKRVTKITKITFQNFLDKFQNFLDKFGKYKKKLYFRENNLK